MREAPKQSFSGLIRTQEGIRRWVGRDLEVSGATGDRSDGRAMEERGDEAGRGKEEKKRRKER